MPIGLDRTDKALLSALQGNARLTVAIWPSACVAKAP